MRSRLELFPGMGNQSPAHHHLHTTPMDEPSGSPPAPSLLLPLPCRPPSPRQSAAECARWSGTDAAGDPAGTPAQVPGHGRRESVDRETTRQNATRKTPTTTAKKAIKTRTGMHRSYARDATWDERYNTHDCLFRQNQSVEVSSLEVSRRNRRRSAAAPNLPV